MTALDGLAEQLARNPEAPFMTEVAASGDRRTLTYGEFDEYSRRAMTWLRQGLGLRAGDVLGLAPRNDLRSMVALFGAMRLGAAVAFLSPEDPLGGMRPSAGLPQKYLNPSGTLPASHCAPLRRAQPLGLRGRGTATQSL